MAKAITTIRQSLHYHSQHADSFVANHALFNRVVAFYFAVIQAHENVLDLSTKEALTALERLTHATSKNRAPVMPLTEIVQDVPAMFRRAGINAALGSARSFYSSLKKWRTRRELAEARKARKGKWKKCTERPPVPPRTWNKSVPFYVGQWKERTDSSILLKVWTGSCWSWIKVRTFGRALPDGVEMGSPAWSDVGSGGGSTHPWRNSSAVQPSLSSKSRATRTPGSVPSISISTPIWPSAPSKLLEVRSSLPALSGMAERYPALGRDS